MRCCRLGRALTLVGATLKRDVDQATQQADSLAVDVMDNQRQLLKKLQSKTMVLDVVQRWEQSEIDWLEEMRRLSDRFPPADQAVVQRISMAPSSGSRGIISMSVRVQDPAIIAQLEQDLRDESHQVSSQRISQSDSNQEFSTQFETSLIVTPPCPRHARRRHARRRLPPQRPASARSRPTWIDANAF